jgi:unsaturated rhamnogalacturonyl hydrolase
MFLAVFLIGCFASGGEKHNSRPWSARIAESFIQRHPGGITSDSASPNQKWNYEQGLMLEAFHQMWLYSHDRKYLNFIEENMDRYIGEDGSIRSYKYSDFTLDNIGPGRALLTLYGETGLQKYMRAADTLRSQLRNQPRTHEGGFWHKQIYPNQMWLDGLYMAEPFYAWYAQQAKTQDNFNDVIDQFVFIARHTLDTKTGLMYHGWDESGQQRWANPRTGCSPSFWGRAMGWYCMALVDVLDFIPEGYPRRDTLITILKNLSASLTEYREKKTGLWYQVVDQGERKGNYLEASASCMFAYAFAKGASHGFLDAHYFAIAESAFTAITENFVVTDDHGLVNLLHTCQGAGLGGHPYRDGSFEYYINEPQRINDLKGIAPFLLAAIEIEKGRASRARQ